MAQTLRSGLVIAGAYADKIRRVLFAQLRELLKAGKVESREVARAAGELNRILYEVFVGRLRLDKGDVVRITVDYMVEDGRIRWLLETLRVEAWRRMPQEEVDAALKGVVEGAEELLAGAIEFTVERVGETDTGDVVYAIRYGDRRVGALLVTPLEGQAVVRGAVREPTPLNLKSTVVRVEGSLDEFIEASVRDLMARAENVERRDAERVIREIEALVEAVSEEGEVLDEE